MVNKTPYEQSGHNVWLTELFNKNEMVIKYRPLFVLLVINMSERKTRPAREEDLIVPNGSHAMKPNDGTPYKLRAALVDGIPAQAGIDPFGTYSERIRILLEHAHDELGLEFQTKRFMIRDEEPGICHWGHKDQYFAIEVFVDDD